MFVPEDVERSEIGTDRGREGDTLREKQRGRKIETERDTERKTEREGDKVRDRVT